MKKAKMVTGLVAATMFLSAFAPYGTMSALADDVDDVHTLDVGVLAAQTALPIVDAVNNGLDAENGIKVNLVNFTDGAAMNEALAAEKIDASFIGAAAVFALANNNAKMIAELSNDTIAINLNAQSDSDIVAAGNTVADYPNILGDAESVKGSVVLCPAGTLSQYEVAKYLSVFGLTLDDIQLVPMDYAQAYQAFKTGQGDIVATRSPQSYTAVDADGYTQIASLTDLKADATAQIICSEKAFNEKSEALAAVLKIVYDENKKLDDDPDYAADVMVDWFSKNGQTIEKNVAVQQLSSKPFYTADDVKSREYGESFKTTIIDFQIDNGQLEESLRGTVEDNIKDDILVAAGLK